MFNHIRRATTFACCHSVALHICPAYCLSKLQKPLRVTKKLLEFYREPLCVSVGSCNVQVPILNELYEKRMVLVLHCTPISMAPQTFLHGIVGFPATVIAYATEQQVALVYISMRLNGNVFA